MLISFSLPALVPSAHYAAPNWETRPNIKKKKVNEKGSHHHQHHPRTRTQHRKRLRLSGEANNLRPFGHLVVEERGPGPAVLTAVTVAAVPDGRKISPTPPHPHPISRPPPPPDHRETISRPAVRCTTSPVSSTKYRRFRFTHSDRSFFCCLRFSSFPVVFFFLRGMGSSPHN